MYGEERLFFASFWAAGASLRFAEMSDQVLTSREALCRGLSSGPSLQAEGPFNECTASGASCRRHLIQGDEEALAALEAGTIGYLETSKLGPHTARLHQVASWPPSKMRVVKDLRTSLDVFGLLNRPFCPARPCSAFGCRIQILSMMAPRRPIRCRFPCKQLTLSLCLPWQDITPLPSPPAAPATPLAVTPLPAPVTPITPITPVTAASPGPSRSRRDRGLDTEICLCFYGTSVEDCWSCGSRCASVLF